MAAELIDGDDGAGSRSPSRRGARLRVGSKVKARYRGRSKYYPGVISRDRGDGTYDIDYDDGEQETRVAAELIDGGDDGAGSRSPSRRGARLRVGSKVKARYRGRSKYYPGVISRDRGDGTYDIDYDDGEQETRVAAELIDGGDDGAGSRSPSRRGARLRVGSKVKARYRGRSKYYPGVISRDRGDGTYDIDYDDGEQETRVAAELIDGGDDGAGSRSPSRRGARLRVGSKVKARYRGRSKYYPGVISRDRGDGTYDIDYDDGEQETRVAAELIDGGDDGAGSRSPSRRGARLRVGSKVKARYRGRSKYYPGVISRDRGDGTYDIDYDDGEQETRVAAELIDGGDDGAGSRSPSRRGARLRVGSKVKARYRGRSKYYPGVISRDRGDGTYDIDYDDGEQETRVAAELIDGGDDGAGSRSPSRRGARLRVGSKVKARYRGRSKYYPGVISRDRGDGTYDIDYDDGEQETRVAAELIDGGDDGAGSRSPSRRGARLRVGSKVKARYRGRSKYYPGVISRDRGDGTYDIDYDDGEQETRVAAELIDGGDDGAGSRSPSRRGARLRVGSKVKARYRGRSKYYPGVISRDRGDGTYDIDYDDGEQETRVAAELIDGGDDGAGSRSPSRRGARLRVGSKVKARYRGRSKYYPGVISRDRGDGTYDIDYDDGEQETRVAAELIDGGDDGAGSRSPSRRGARLRVGSKVKARYRGRSKYYPGVISRDRGDGTYDIDYDDGEQETRVAAELIGGGDDGAGSRSPSRRGARLRVGSKVKARYRGRSKYYPGVISRDRGDGTYDIDYDDGEQETRVAAELIDGGDDGAGSRSPSRRGARLRVGSKVKARYRGRSKYYPGKISRDRGDGTYDIDYDDGEQETRVAAELIDGGDDGAGSRSPSRRGARLRVGSKVKARYRGRSKYYPGVISRDRGDGTYDIDYDDGEQETRVAAELIDGGDDGAGSRSPSRRGGLRSRSPRGGLEVSFRSDQFSVGCRVRARYKGGRKFYPGVIVKCHQDGTFDVDYDDGEFESRLTEDLMELEVKSMGKALSTRKNEFDSGRDSRLNKSASKEFSASLSTANEFGTKKPTLRRAGSG